MTESTLPAFTMPELPMDILTIREYLPHRYPFLLGKLESALGKTPR